MADRFFKNVSKVAARTIICHGLGLLALPVLSRLYSPSEFGAYAFFLAIALPVAAVANARYEVAIPLPKEDSEARAVLRLCLYVSTGLSMLFFVLIYLFPIRHLALIEHSKYILPIHVFSQSGMSAVSYWLTRRGRFTAFAVVGIVQVVLTTGLQIACGLADFSVNGLIAGHATAIFVTFAIALMAVYFPKSTERYQPVRLSNVARMYRKNPIFLVPAHFINSLCSQVPTFFITGYHGAGAAGVYHLAQQIVLAPSNLVGISVSQVFYPEAARHFGSKGNCMDIYGKMVRILTIIIVPLSLTIALVCYLFLGPILGESWQAIGAVAAILAIGNIVRAINGPVSGVWMIAEKQHLDLLWQVLYLILIGSAFMLTESSSVVVALWFYSAAITVVFSVNMLACKQFARGSHCPVAY